MPVFPRTFREKQALQQARIIAALCAFSHPQGRRFPVHRQVSRLGFLRRNTFPAIFFASGCTNSSAHVPLSASRLLGQRRSCTGFPCSPNTPVSDAAHRCAPVWAVHLSRILYMLTAHLSICYASLTLSRRFAIILMEETALVDFIRFLCISFRTQGASSLSKPKSSMDNPVSPVTIKIKQHGSERAEGVKGAIADFVRFHCTLVASAEAKPLRPKSTISEKAIFSQKKKAAPLFGAPCRTFSPIVG